MTQEAKESIREYLLGVKARSSAEQSLFTALRQYLNQYSQNYGIHTDLVVPPELEEKRIDSTIEAQLQPIIQEALTNVRKHSGASSARVIFALCDGEIRVTIEDDGRGFDPEEISENQGFGLRSMRGRAEAVGARLEVNSDARQRDPGDRSGAMAKGGVMKILLVDDHPLFLDGLKNLLTIRGIEVVGTARDGLEALEKARALQPEVILMDIQMPHLDGLGRHPPDQGGTARRQDCDAHHVGER